MDILAFKRCMPESRSSQPVLARKLMSCAIVLSCLYVVPALAQLDLSASQSGAVAGTVTDVNGDFVPGADVTLQSSITGVRRSVVSDDNGAYTFITVPSAGSYSVTISAVGFATWTSPGFIVRPGETFVLPGGALHLIGNGNSVTVYAFSEHTAAEEVKIEERQRVLGFMPNFYVVYDRRAEPLTAKLKFKLSLRATTDPVFFAAVGLTAGVDQAGDFPNYVQGAKGYGQRLGAVYLNGISDILVGEAILPSLLHQDPRYFYQGTGTTRSRILHSLSNAFVCKGDDGHSQPNYSAIGGDLISGAISNSYYPQSNRGVGLVFRNAAISSGGRMVNGIVQEFLLRRFTPSARNQKP